MGPETRPRNPSKAVFGALMNVNDVQPSACTARVLRTMLRFGSETTHIHHRGAHPKPCIARQIEHLQVCEYPKNIGAHQWSLIHAAHGGGVQHHQPPPSHSPCTVWTV